MPIYASERNNINKTALSSLPTDARTSNRRPEYHGNKISSISSKTLQDFLSHSQFHLARSLKAEAKDTSLPLEGRGGEFDAVRRGSWAALADFYTHLQDPARDGVWKLSFFLFSGRVRPEAPCQDGPSVITIVLL